MIQGIHIEVLLAAGYALLLVTIAALLQWLARRVHRRSEQSRHSGFTFHRKLDVWECPTGHHLQRVDTDFERKIARYRAPAHKCNACHCKKDCTDSDTGRELESRMDAWLESEMRRFHTGISLALLLLAACFLVAEMFQNRGGRDWLVLAPLLFPIVFIGSRCFVAFTESARKSQFRLEEPNSSRQPHETKT